MKKRIIAMLLTLLMVFSVLLPITAFAETVNTTFYLTGERVPRNYSHNGMTSFQTNDDEQSEVIEISTPQQLNDIRNNLGGSYKLVNDIDLSSFGDWTPIGIEDDYFYGTFDGNNHVISNMTVNYSVSSYESANGGLFGYVQNATIENLGMVGANVNVVASGSASYAAAGAIAGYILYTEIKNCYNSGDGNITASCTTDYYAAIAGGIVGAAENSTASNCFNTTPVSAYSGPNSYNSYAGGISGGDQWSFEIENCYNTGEIYAYTDSSDFCAYSGGITGFVGFGDSSSLKYCYSLSPITADSEYEGNAFSGGIAGANNINYPSSASYCFFLDNVEKPIGNDSRTFSTMYELTAEEMHIEESFLGFDFDNVWIMPEGGIPTLRGIPGELQPTTIVSLFLSHRILDSEEYVRDTEYGTFMFRRYYIEIIADVSNTNITSVNDINLEIELPDGLVLSDNETLIKNLGTVAPFTTHTVKWNAEYTCISTSPDVNLDYVVTITSSNTESYSNYGSIFIHGINDYNNILDFSKDTWRFENYSVNPIPVLDDDLEAFKYGMDNASKETLDRIIASGANGQCAGMAITTVLAKVGRLNLHQIQSGAPNLHAINQNEKAESVIGYYYLTQFLSPYQNNKIEFQKLSVQDRLARIAELADEVDSGAAPFVIMFGYQNPFDASDCWGHAVTAYSLEHGSFDIGSRNYDTRVLIYDNNSPEWNEDCCLYFNEGTDEWVIPAYTDANQLRGAFSDINQMDANSLSINEKNVRSSVRAQGNMNLQFTTSDDTATLSQILNNDVNGVVAFPDDTEDRNSDSMNIFFEDSEQSFIIKPTQTGASIDLTVNYENYYMAADMSSCDGSVTFDPDGSVGINGDADTFSLALTGNAGNYDLPWHTITVSGDSAQDPELSKVNGGYIMTGSQLDNITVSGKNDTENQVVTFSTDEDTVFIGESDDEIAVFVDENGDGQFETQITSVDSTADKWWETLPDWIQWILRYVLFGWIWMR